MELKVIMLIVLFSIVGPILSVLTLILVYGHSNVEHENEYVYLSLLYILTLYGSYIYFDIRFNGYAKDRKISCGVQYE